MVSGMSEPFGTYSVYAVRYLFSSFIFCFAVLHLVLCFFSFLFPYNVFMYESLYVDRNLLYFIEFLQTNMENCCRFKFLIAVIHLLSFFIDLSEIYSSKQNYTKLFYLIIPFLAFAS